MKRQLLLFLCVSVSSCGTMYSPPAAGPQAALKIVAKDSASYFAYTRDVTDTCSRDSPTFPVIGASTKTESLQTRVAAGRPIALTVSTIYDADFVDMMFINSAAGKVQYNKVAWTCAKRIDFTPVAGKSYELLYDFSRSRCEVLVSALETVNGVETKVPVDSRTSQATCGTATAGG